MLDVRKIGILYCSDNILDEGLLYSHHFTEETRCFGVLNAHFRVYVGGDAIRNDEWTRVIQVDEWCD